ncbi:helix-turn-helix domain-containing protein [Pseudomonas serbica]
MSAAAHSANLTFPALGLQFHQLKHGLGVNLFERNSRGLRLPLKAKFSSKPPRVSALIEN